MADTLKEFLNQYTHLLLIDEVYKMKSCNILVKLINHKEYYALSIEYKNIKTKRNPISMKHLSYYGNHDINVRNLFISRLTISHLYNYLTCNVTFSNPSKVHIFRHTSIQQDIDYFRKNLQKKKRILVIE